MLEKKDIKMNDLTDPLLPNTNVRPVNGKHTSLDEEEDDANEDDLILGDESNAEGNEEEYDVELDDEFDEADIDEDDLVIDKDDDTADEDL